MKDKIRLRNWDEFVAYESNDSSHYNQKVAIVRQEWDSGPVVNKMLSEVFNSLSTVDINEDFKVPSNVPVLFWGGFNESTNKLIKEKDNLINSPKVIREAYNKERFYKAFEGEEFVPKTVYNKFKTRKLRFPVIAKKKYSHLGESKVYKRYKEIEKDDANFSLFQEKVQPKREYRAFFINEELVSLTETIDGVDIEQRLVKVPFVDKLEEAAKKITKKFPLRAFSSDIVLNEDNSVYFLNAKAESYLTPNQLIDVYEKIYEENNDLKLPVWYKNRVKDVYCAEYNEHFYQKNKEVIERSPYAIQYK